MALSHSLRSLYRKCSMSTARKQNTTLDDRQCVPALGNHLPDITHGSPTLYTYTMPYTALSMHSLKLAPSKLFSALISLPQSSSFERHCSACSRTERPLAAAELVRPVVALAREVNPFGVPELVAHEVEPRLAADGHRDHPDHHVQRHGPLQPRHLVVDLV